MPEYKEGPEATEYREEPKAKEDFERTMVALSRLSGTSAAGLTSRGSSGSVRGKRSI